MQTQEETALFESAEQRYARGDYDGALTLYEEFLERHPLSPLAALADQRQATIERELDAVMGRRGAPAPVHVNPYGLRAVEVSGGDSLAPVEAPHLPTFGR